MKNVLVLIVWKHIAYVFELPLSFAMRLMDVIGFTCSYTTPLISYTVVHLKNYFY